MTEKEFIEKLKEIPFCKNKYFEKGLDEEFVIKTYQRYNPKKKSRGVSIYENSGVVALLNNYDLSETEIGMVWF